MLPTKKYNHYPTQSNLLATLGTIDWTGSWEVFNSRWKGRGNGIYQKRKMGRKPLQSKV